MKQVGWAATALICMLMTVGGILHLIGYGELADNIRSLGYPDYFQKMLGVSKLLGVAALLGPYPRLKEWAYAGFTFNLVAAYFSHVAMHDPPGQTYLSVGVLVMLMVSYWFHFRYPSRGQQAYGL